MIPCFARFHPTFRRRRTWRIVSGLSARAVHAFSWHTPATNPRVHRLVGLPSARGDWCNRPLRSSSRSRGQTGGVVFGAFDRGARHSTPSAWNARIASRTVWVAHPRVVAIRAGRCPSALARRIWDRRRVKASGDRRPPRRAARSVSVRFRTNSGSFIPSQ